MTAAEARAIVGRHKRWVTVRGKLEFDLCLGHPGPTADERWPCDAHRAATAYLASVAVVEAADRFDRAFQGPDYIGKQGKDLHQALRALAEAAAKETDYGPKLIPPVRP